MANIFRPYPELNLELPDATTISSGEAADGTVLTADGAGGTAWEAAAGGSSNRVVIVKTSDETRASTTTFATDSTLFTGTLEAGSIYRIMASINWAGHASWDIKFRWHKESGLGDAYLSGSFANNSVSAACQVFDTAMNGAGGGVAARRQFSWIGHVITATNTGVLSLQWAQLASGVDVSTVFTGSWIVVEKIN